MRSNAAEIVDLSGRTWRWMSERDAVALDDLFHEDAVFVHMGATLVKAQELEIIRSGEIQYKTVDIHEVSVPFLDDTTAILLNRLDLVAVVGGNEVTNPFVVTEVYVDYGGRWALASMSFTRLVTH
jgi:hypothetical protein